MWGNRQSIWRIEDFALHNMFYFPNHLSDGIGGVKTFQAPLYQDPYGSASVQYGFFLGFSAWPYFGSTAG